MTRHEPSYDVRLAEVKRLLAEARPEQIQRLLEDPLSEKVLFKEFPAGSTILVGGRNFGCGSSREHAPLALKGAGISCVVAESFARIFYRNSINIGLPILECPQAVAGTEAGQVLEVDLAKGTVKNVDTGQVFQAGAYPEFLMAIVDAGGLIPYTRQKLGVE